MNDSSSASPQRALPAVQTVLAQPSVQAAIAAHGRIVVKDWIRAALDALRADPVSAAAPNGATTPVRDALLARVVRDVESRAANRSALQIGPVINATGTVLHTGLGRAPLSNRARAALDALAGSGNVELDLVTGARSERGSRLADDFRLLTGAPDALVVNNNAAATWLVLHVLCAGREVLLARGQLVEIGGSFRLPDIFAASGAILREVGTTNRTRLADYEAALGPQTAAVLRVHPSNYRIVGFAEEPDIGPLAALARSRGTLAIDDIGSGCLLDTTRLGLPPEPSFPASLAAGADLVLGSGDKLLGGPQCGIILGRADLVQRLRRHPLARCVRVDKLVLAALSATLDSYLHETAETELPVWSRLTASLDALRARAEAIAKLMADRPDLDVRIAEDVAPVGGGSLPGTDRPTIVLLLRPPGSADDFARALRTAPTRVLPRVQDSRVILDLRSVDPTDDVRLADAVREAAGRLAPSS